MNGDTARRIVIVGGGTSGWMTAAALGRFLGPPWQVTLVESEEIGTVGVGEATIPMIRNFNLALGIDEAEFLAATQGTYKLGIQFEGWGGFGQTYMHAFGMVGRSLGLLPFHQYWLRGRAEGLAGPLGDYVLNAVIAGQNRFAHVERRPGSPLPAVPYAYHFDASLYARFLRRFAELRGVTRREGRIAEVARHGENGDVAAVILTDGTRIEGDLFVDCSGFRALLLGEALGVPYVSWAKWLACDRAVAVPSRRCDPLVPYTRSIAEPAGWRWRIPLQHRTGNGHVWCSDHMGEDEATTRLLAGLDAEPLADPRVLRFTAGRRERFWERNVVAIGLASGFIEPLESTSIHLVQTAINRLLDFLPSGAVAAADRDGFNRLAVWEIERIRDFVVAHYVCNGRAGEPFWDYLRTVDLPETLAERIAMFRATGRIVREGDELFDVVGWAQVLIGQGVIPDAWHPLADQPDRDQLAGFLDTLTTAYLRDAERMPAHADHVARFCPAGDIDVAA
ncbi:tryptophan halogenase [Novosphingobium kunmingense]|uniref:Tryptophan halogenase n=1 Tax=Novosphingobium kunmingense TaxID=1211806 RepID=A0A2N0HK55_9SPHN|nr:tryptophan halogenase family protein [Novosphingobium kunmingense]PKB19332.1 tryptophan halogenase [Novosphingobium kunmingense]